MATKKGKSRRRMTKRRVRRGGAIAAPAAVQQPSVTVEQPSPPIESGEDLMNKMKMGGPEYVNVLLKIINENITLLPK